MQITRFREFLTDRGMVYFYSIFIAGYFLMPMAAGHRRLYYILVAPAVLLLWKQLRDFYRGNLLCMLLLAFTLYMMLSLFWTANLDAAEAWYAAGYSLALLTFCFISGYLWLHNNEQMAVLARRSVWLAAAAALVSMIAWYTNHPFPGSRLEPLGVMHHPNKTSCAYAVFLILCVRHLSSREGRDQKLTYNCMAAILLALVLFTQSRTALAGLGVGLMVLIGYRALLVPVIGGAIGWFLMAPNTQEWVARTKEFSFRPGIWQQVLADMEGHWWFGHGFLARQEVEAYNQVFSHAHNSYLASLRDGGLVGLALLLLLLSVACLWAFRLYRWQGQRVYLALLLMAMTCIAMDFDRLLVHPKEMWLYFWLPIALIMAAYPRCEPNAKSANMAPLEDQSPPHR